MCVGPLKSHSQPAAAQPTIAPPPPPPPAATAEAGLQLEGKTVGNVAAGYSGLRLGAGDLRVGGKAFAQPAASLNPNAVVKAPTATGFALPSDIQQILKNAALAFGKVTPTPAPTAPLGGIKPFGAGWI